MTLQPRKSGTGGDTASDSLHRQDAQHETPHDGHAPHHPHDHHESVHQPHDTTHDEKRKAGSS